MFRQPMAFGPPKSKPIPRQLAVPKELIPTRRTSFFANLKDKLVERPTQTIVNDPPIETSIQAPDSLGYIYPWYENDSDTTTVDLSLPSPPTPSHSNILSNESHKTKATTPSLTSTSSSNLEPPHQNPTAQKAHKSTCKCNLCNFSIPSIHHPQFPRRGLTECKLCVVALPPSKFPGRPPTARCEHPAEICKGCMEYVIRKAKAGVAEREGTDYLKRGVEVECLSCGEHLGHADLVEFGGKENRG